MKSTCALLALLIISPATLAAPANWYVFKSRSTGAEVCLQSAPDDYWTAVRGPFRDAGCRVPRKS